MKEAFFTVLTAVSSALSFAQSTGRIPGLQDAFGSTYTYIGEIKNKKPHGMGVAIYNNNNALRYMGSFENGMFSGKGVLLFTNGTFLCGDWKHGKLNGKGAHLNQKGDLYVGDFLNGLKQGDGSFVYGDNGLLVGKMANDVYNGRCIYIGPGAATLSDNLFTDGKKSGCGYQYEVENKRYFEGEWKEGNWMQSAPASYKSFIKNSNFYAEKTNDQILMGCVDKNNNDLLQDTGFYYDLKHKKRYFGHYDKGYLSNGIVIKDDSSRFFGNLNDNGASGYCSYYKVKSYYDEGTYANDLLNGNHNLSIDLKRMTVYLGQTAQGEFTGKAWFFNNKNELFHGDYVEGKFTGNGFRIDKDGVCVRGTWSDGTLVKVNALTGPNGETIPLAPKNLAQAISISKLLYASDFEAVCGKALTNKENLPFEEVYEGFLALPGSSGNNFVTEGAMAERSYWATCLKTSSIEKARTKYSEIAGQVLAAVVSGKGIKPVKLTGKIESVDAGKPNTISKFFFPGQTNENTDFSVCVLLRKSAGNEYEVVLAMGNAANLQQSVKNAAIVGREAFMVNGQ